MISFEEKEKNGLDFVEQAAATLSSHFFLDSGEGRDLETETLYLMDFSGWLIPDVQKEEFESSDRWDNKWNSFFVFAKWKDDSGKISIEFVKYPQYDAATLPTSPVVVTKSHTFGEMLQPTGT